MKSKLDLFFEFADIFNGERPMPTPVWKPLSLVVSLAALAFVAGWLAHSLLG